MKILAIDLGGSSFKTALVDENGNISEKFKLEIHPDSVEELWQCFDQIITREQFKDAEGIALSMPGQIDQKRGIAHNGGAYKYIKDLEIGKYLSETYHKKVVVDNDGKCAANAELWLGALKDVENGLVYGIGTGIAGGIVINHKVYKGSHFTAGEFSIPLFNMFKDAQDNNISAIHVSTNALMKNYQENLGSKEPVNGIQFFTKVNENDEIAVRTLKDFCKLTANFLFTLQSAFDVDRIAIGGGISAQDSLINGLREAVDNVFDNFDGPFTKPEIVRCQFENDANLLGAVRFYLDAE